jgi:hypothetical protein
MHEVKKEALNDKGGDKKLEITDLERKHDFRLEYRQRLDLFFKSVLAFSAGGLTISMTHFLKAENIPKHDNIISVLQNSWVLLFITILTFSICQFIIVLQGRYIITKWETEVSKSYDSIVQTMTMKVIRAVVLALGVAGFLTFILGLVSLCYAVNSAVNIARG